MPLGFRLLYAGIHEDPQKMQRQAPGFKIETPLI